MTSDWISRHPDLTGKAVVVAGESSVMVEIAGQLIANDALLAVLAPARELVEEIVAIAEAAGSKIVGLTVDVSAPETWDRVTSHIEQRLGPIDVLVAVATEPTRRVIIGALLPDMTARKRGVIVEVGSVVPQLEPPHGVRYRTIQGDNSVTPNDIASCVLLAASDTVAVPSLAISLGQPPG